MTAMRRTSPEQRSGLSMERVGRVTAGALPTKPEVRVTSERDDIAVVSLLGEHDFATAAEVKNTLRCLLEEGAVIVVDLSETEFIDSSVIFALVDEKLLASEHGSRMGFQLQTSTAVHRVLEICGLLEVWPVYGSRREAVATLTHGLAPPQVMEAQRPVLARHSPVPLRYRQAFERVATGRTRRAEPHTKKVEVT
jgi:anti-anti-sigma factor